MASHRRGVTLRDLMVLILVIGVLIALVLPAIHDARRTSRRATCARNLRGLALGLHGHLTAKGHYPNAGTFREFPGTTGPAPSTILGCFTDVTGVGFLPKVVPTSKLSPDVGPLHSWVVDILPYIDAQDLADVWDHERNYAATYSAWATGSPSNASISSESMSKLTCPEDTTVRTVQGNLSYVVTAASRAGSATRRSAGRGRRPGGIARGPGPIGESTSPRQMGVMFLGTDTGGAPWDRRTTATSITDGTSNTVLASENLRAGASPGLPATAGLATNWACPHPNAILFIASDKVCPGGRGPRPFFTPHGPDDSVWSPANAPATNRFKSINSGVSDTVAEGASPFPSSRHPGGVNALFCDGSVRFLKETISGTVYTNILTPVSRIPSAISY